MDILLLEPYWKTLITMAWEEEILTFPSSLDTTRLENKRWRRDKIRMAVLQMLMLADNLQAINYEKTFTQTDKERIGAREFSLAGLEKIGLVEFVAPETKLDLRGAKSPHELWQIAKVEIKELRALIRQDLVVKGYIQHPSLFDVLYESRLGNQDTLSKATKRVPNEYQIISNSIINNHLNPTQILDKVTFTTLHELIAAEKISYVTCCAVAHPNIGNSNEEYQHEVGETVSIFLNIVLSQLLQDDLLLPTPDNLKEALRLRNNQNIRDFREQFHSWINKLRTGDEQNEILLRKEVMKAVKAYKREPWLKKPAIALNVVSLFPIPILSQLSAVLGMGLNSFAERCQKKGGWVGITNPNPQ